jgi:hypothetical protein
MKLLKHIRYRYKFGVSTHRFMLLLLINKYGVKRNKCNAGRRINIFPTTATVSTSTIANNDIRNNIYFFPFQRPRRKILTADDKTLLDIVTGI